MDYFPQFFKHRCNCELDCMDMSEKCLFFCKDKCLDRPEEEYNEKEEWDKEKHEFDTDRWDNDKEEWDKDQHDPDDEDEDEYHCMDREGMFNVRGKRKRCNFATSPEHKLCKRRAFRMACPVTCDRCDVDEKDCDKEHHTNEDKWDREEDESEDQWDHERDEWDGDENDSKDQEEVESHCADREGIFNVQGRMKRCNFATSPEHKICKRQQFRTACPVTCGMCDVDEEEEHRDDNYSEDHDEDELDREDNYSEKHEEDEWDSDANDSEDHEEDELDGDENESGDHEENELDRDENDLEDHDEDEWYMEENESEDHHDDDWVKVQHDNDSEDHEEIESHCADREGMFNVQGKMKRCNFSTSSEHKLCKRQEFKTACSMTCGMCDVDTNEIDRDDNDSQDHQEDE